MARNTLDADYVYVESTKGEGFSVKESAEVWEVRMVLEGYAERFLCECGVNFPKVSQEFAPGSVSVLNKVMSNGDVNEEFCRQLYVLVNDEYCLPIMERRSLLMQLYRVLIELGEIVE